MWDIFSTIIKENGEKILNLYSLSWSENRIKKHEKLRKNHNGGETYQQQLKSRRQRNTKSLACVLPLESNDLSSFFWFATLVCFVMLLINQKLRIYKPRDLPMGKYELSFFILPSL